MIVLQLDSSKNVSVAEQQNRIVFDVAFACEVVFFEMIAVETLTLDLGVVMLLTTMRTGREFIAYL